MISSVLRVLACGSVDDGKSTLIGRLLFECGTIPDDVMRALERDSLRFGTTGGGVDYALLVDGLAAEREQGITIDIAYRYFQTEKRRFILADAPGHEQYTRNMATGASRADLAVLLVDARKGLLPQTYRHATIASLFGVRQIILAVNKMDLMDFSQQVFGDITGQFRAFSERLKIERVTAIPVCARDGDNVTRPSERMPWYTGRTLLDAMEASAPARVAASAAFRMQVQHVNRVGADYRGYSGTIAAGTIRPGQTIANVLARTEAVVDRIVAMGGDLAEAGPGDAVSVTLDREIDISRGDVLASDTLPERADKVSARIVWFGETPLFRGREYLCLFGPRAVTGTVVEIAHRLDVETLAEEPVRELKFNEVGRASIALNQPIAFDPYRTDRAMGSFILIDRQTRNTVGAGLIEAAEKETVDVFWHKLDIDKAARAALKGQKPAVLWFTGLSGSGKSTIANLVEKALAAQGRHTMILDGDNVRHGLNRDLGFSEADRVENVRRIAEVSRLFVESGMIVLASFISPYRAERMLARERVEDGEFVEIFVDTPIDECRRRDPKGLYARADSGALRNFTGVDAPYEAPENPEIRLKTLDATPEMLAEQVVMELRRRGIIT